LPALFIKLKKVKVNFTLSETLNDGGLLLLREVGKQIGIKGRLSACIEDHRHQSYVKHFFETMLNYSGLSTNFLFFICSKASNITCT